MGRDRERERKDREEGERGERESKQVDRLVLCEMTQIQPCQGLAR